MTNNDVRRAHGLLDLLKGRVVLSQEQEKLLRSFLPDLPEQKTLEEIYEYVDDAWLEADDPESKEWLHELHAQLKGLKDTPAAVAALPAGMRIAVHAVYGRVVVSPVVDDDGTCKIFHLSTHTRDGSDYCWAPIDSLTFIDYEPAKPAKPAHPEFLETEADYANAPEGTVVARDNGLPWVKEKSNYWTGPDAAKSDYGMSLGSRRVLRWGWGE